MGHIQNQFKHQCLKQDSTLHVIGVISNPARYHSRYRLFREWEARMRATPNVELHIVELAFGDRHHEISGQGSCLQLRGHQHIWLKENMINLGVKHLLPIDWKYVAWIDCDVFFHNDHWALETIQQLQHYPVVQPWSECLDLGPHGQIMEMHKSFGQICQKRIKRQRHHCEPYQFAHPGFAWACTRGFWEAVCGLIDFPILGSGDHHMATAMIGEVGTSIHNGSPESFKRKCYEWQKKALRKTHGQVGYVPGVLSHKFHGAKKKRFYRERWQILVDHKYCPDTDLSYDEQGLLTLVGKPLLDLDIHKYNLSRDEDGTSID